MRPNKKTHYLFITGWYLSLPDVPGLLLHVSTEGSTGHHSQRLPEHEQVRTGNHLGLALMNTCFSYISVQMHIGLQLRQCKYKACHGPLFEESGYDYSVFR